MNSKYNLHLIGLCAILLTTFVIAGCPPVVKEFPTGLGYQSTSSGSCDDGDNTDGPGTSYDARNALRRCRDAATFAQSDPVDFRTINEHAAAITGQHATAACYAFPTTKVKSTLVVTKNEAIDFVIGTRFVPYLQSGDVPQVRVVANISDNAGRSVGNFQFVYTVKMDPANPNNLLVALNGGAPTNLTNGQAYSDTQRTPKPIQLAPGTYFFQFEVNTEIHGDGTATIDVSSSVDFQ
jgi:hypothetical protein